jgi:hypothetical protein
MIIGYSRTFGASLPLTNLTAQFDASSLSYLWKTYSGATPIYSNQATADGDTIGVWSSKYPASPSDYCIYEDLGSSRYATLRSSSPGLQQQCLDLDGSNDFYTLGTRTGTGSSYTAFFSTTAMTLFVSFRIDVMPTSGNYGPIIMAGTGNYWGMRIQGTSGKIAYLMHDAGGYTGHEGSVVSANTNYVACMQHDTTTVYGSINHGSVSSSASGTFDQGTVVSLVGADTGLGWYFNGRIGEILCYNAVLSGADLTNAWDYMMNKWL